MNSSVFKSLFEPLEMPNLKLKNRLFMAPMGTSFDIPQLTDYMVARGKGEIGLITSPETTVHPTTRSGGILEQRLESDEDIKLFVPLTKAVKKSGTKIVAQLNHMGRYCHSLALGHQSVAPSAVGSRYTGETPRELSTQEVDELVIAFAEASRRAQEAGFDGVEFCGNSGYLISQFLSPFTNRREDKYGGDIDKRAVFMLSILEETRKRTGEDFNLCIKFDADDGMEGGKTLEDSLYLAPKFVEAGADRLHIWAGWHEASRPMLPMFVERGAFTYMSKAIKEVVDVPVATVGRINDPYVAASIIEEGGADMIGLGRPLLCDPDFAKKTMENRPDEIRRCIACCYCFDQMMAGAKKGLAPDLKCALNPELGHETENLIQTADNPKRVAVVGGGPAGMEAARVATLRGHQVTIIDSGDKLGGMVNLAHLPPHKQELKNILDYYNRQMDLLNVDIKTNKTLSTEVIEEIKPEVVVLATGATEIIPGIPGIDSGHVVTSSEILTGDKSAGDNVVVIGGGLIGVETAEFIADKGKKVTVVEMLRSVAADLGATSRWGTLSRIKRKVDILVLTTVVEVKKNAVVVKDQDDKTIEIPADTVVIAAGMKSRAEMTIDDTDLEVIKVGSCKNPGLIAEAVADGFEAGCKI